MRKLTISEIKTMGNKAVVESFAAKIITVYKPTDPSPAQAEAGIHKQGIVVGLGDETLSVTLNEATLHMDKSFEGEMMNFTCTSSDDGRPVGMVVNRWMKGDQERIGVDVWGKAEMFKVSADGVQQPPAQDNEPAKPIDYLQGVKNYAGAHFAVYEIFKDYYDGEITNGEIADKSTHYLIGADSAKIKGICQQLARADEPEPAPEESERSEEPPTDAAQVIEQETIEEAKQPEPAPEASQAEEIPSNDAEPEPIPWDKVTDSEGKVISEMSRDDLIDLCLKLIPFSDSDHPVIKPGYEAMENSRQMMELSYADIYDVYEVLLNQNHDLQAISDAYKVIDTQYKGEVESVCKAILSDQKTFVQMVENHEPQVTPA